MYPNGMLIAMSSEELGRVPKNNTHMIVRTASPVMVMMNEKMSM